MWGPCRNEDDPWQDGVLEVWGCLRPPQVVEGQGLRWGIGVHALAPDVTVCTVETIDTGGMAPARGGVRATCDDCVVQVGGSGKDATGTTAGTGKDGGR